MSSPARQAGKTAWLTSAASVRQLGRLHGCALGASPAVSVFAFSCGVVTLPVVPAGLVRLGRPKRFWKWVAGSIRFGEADNPGPRRRVERPARQLAEVELVEPATAALRARYYDTFAKWVEAGAGEGAFEYALLAPQLLVRLLAGFAQHLYDAGTPLHYYRQLVAFVQREVPSCRPWVRTAWEFVSRWELLEPLQHRPPLPEPILHAMCTLAVLWGWSRWAAITLTGFYAICRPSEPLRARREHLVTSEDLLETGFEIFLRIPEPKTRRRGARVQHAQVKAPLWIREFISAIFQPLHRDRPLYDGSAGMYRRRWDALLKVLLVEPQHRLTPGSLRGGGAVRAFRSGEALNEVEDAPSAPGDPRLLPPRGHGSFDIAGPQCPCQRTRSERSRLLADRADRRRAYSWPRR